MARNVPPLVLLRLGEKNRQLVSASFLAIQPNLLPSSDFIIRGKKKKDSEKEVRGSRRRLGGEQGGPFGLSLSPVKWA